MWKLIILLMGALLLSCNPEIEKKNKPELNSGPFLRDDENPYNKAKIELIQTDDRIYTVRVLGAVCDEFFIFYRYSKEEQPTPLNGYGSFYVAEEGTCEYPNISLAILHGDVELKVIYSVNQEKYETDWQLFTL